MSGPGGTASGYRAGVSQTGYSRTFSGVPSFAEPSQTRSVPHWAFGTVYATVDVERAALAEAGGHRLLIGDRLAGPVEERDPERRLEQALGGAGDAAGVAERGARRRPVDEDRRQLVVEPRPADRPVEDDPLAAEDRHDRAVDLEQDRVDRRELGQRVDDLGEAELGRRAAAAGRELARQVDRRDAVLDRQPQQLRAGRDRARDRLEAVALDRGAREQRVHRRGRDASVFGTVEEVRNETLAAGRAVEDEVRPDDRAARRGGRGGRAWAGARLVGRGRDAGGRGDVGIDRAERRLRCGLERRDGPERAARGAAGADEDERQDGRDEGRAAECVAVHRLGSLAVVICLGSSSPSFAIGSPPGNGRVTGRRSSTRRPPPSRLLAVSSPPSSVACSAAIARPRPLLPPWRDGSAL